ncbi:MAG: class I adenylate cyclase [Candidatus Thiodiazotropha sp. (ex Dulcina madagascariensis)]|nr:class I adenylate cyclase [Candidatus Thiodiazotropha sp. (ex Dulcina madagascariensis)]MCU7925771.1 class I adenylate cyclase [Candidatus Thiodiazotropha sp. (ex Dulcina madagascariensis)]
MPDSQRISFDEGISRKELNAVRQRFMGLHRERLRRIQAELRPGQQEFLELLPLLLHINHPMLPGFVSSETPTGIPDYSPSKQALDAAKKLGRSFEYKKRAQRIYRIHGLYLMGSTGTIGQSSGSDFDLWLCHDSALNLKQRQKLQDKIALIEKSAAELDLELHIFLIDPERFRKGEKSKLSQESTGTTQHNLLLEEFYRSAVLLAGRYPLWWLVPPEHEDDYQAYVDNLLSHRFVKAAEVFDLGGLDHVQAGEFFGAALWQLYKGVDSPYKSILKIFLMEAYSRHYPHPQWLAQQAKEAIYAGESDIDKLDAYILLYQKVEEYLKRNRDEERLELARRCFYFKVGEHLSQARDSENWRIQAMLKLTRQWGWGQTQLQMLDTRSEWKIDRVIKERNALVGVLTRSYRLLTDFARKYAKESHIDPHELNLLGRKLYTALDHRPGKIDHINPGISKNLSEEQLSLHHRPTRDGMPAWMLYRDKVEEVDLMEQRPIKISTNLVEILLWSHVNQVWGGRTRVSLFSAETGLARNELLSLQRSINRLFPTYMPPSAQMKTLARPAYAVMVALFINIGTDPMEHLTKEGMQLTSERHDPLSFASARTNLAINLEKLLQTSWGELQVTRHDGPEGLMDVLCSILDMQSEEEFPPTQIYAYSFSSVRGSQIANRVTELFNHVIARFRSGELRNGRYAFRMGKEFFIVQQQEKGYVWRSQESFGSLLDELKQPQQVYRELEFDPEILANSPYPALFKKNKPDVIQLFYQIKSQETDIYVLDEQGALFQQTLAADSPRFLMLQQRRFLNSLQQLRNLVLSGESDLLVEPEFHELFCDKDGQWLTKHRRVPLMSADDYMELTLVSDSAEADARPVSLICGEREFTRLEYSGDLYSTTADYIHSFRQGDVKYPIYLTSIRLSGIHTLQGLATVDLLSLKKRVEMRLNAG